MVDDTHVQKCVNFGLEMHYFCNPRSPAQVQVTNHVDNQHYVISNAKLHGKYFLEIFQKDIKSGIETANKFSLIFPIAKGGESGSINFSHPSTLLQTNTICTIGFIDGIHKEKVETPLAFELSLVEVTGVSADFALANITPTTNQVFSNPFTLIHTTHSSYTARSEFNCLDDKFYYDPDTDWIFDSGATKHICQNRDAFTNFRTINETIKSSSEKNVVISGVGDVTINIQIGNEKVLCTLRDVWYSQPLQSTYYQLSVLRHTITI
jgi:hypothetical protein